MPRPKLEINWKEFEACCAMQCTLREIADYFNCSERTIESKVREHYKLRFCDTFRRRRQSGLISLRRNLFEMSKKQPQVAIFLAKNWLGMTDKQEVEHSGNIGIKPEELTDSELIAIVEGNGRHRIIKTPVSPQSSN